MLHLSNDVCSFSVAVANQKLLAHVCFQHHQILTERDATLTYKNTKNFLLNEDEEKLQTTLKS